MLLILFICFVLAEYLQLVLVLNLLDREQFDALIKVWKYSLPYVGELNFILPKIFVDYNFNLFNILNFDVLFLNPTFFGLSNHSTPSFFNNLIISKIIILVSYVTMSGYLLKIYLKPK